MLAQEKELKQKTKKDKDDEDEIEHKKPFNHIGVNNLINLHQFVDKLIQEKEKEENDIFSLSKKKKKRTKKKPGQAQAFDDSGSQKSGSTNMFQPGAFGSKPQSIKEEQKPERILTSLERKRQDIK